MIERRRIQPATRARARHLRRNQTPAEPHLWHHVRGKQLEGLRFRRQHPIGRFVVDFYCPAHKLIIEIDGDTHAFQVDYDEARTDWLEAQGFQVVRFTNSEVLGNVEGVVEVLLSIVRSGRE